MERSKLVEARKKRHWTQQQAAVRIGIDANTLSRWERGAAEPRSYHIEQICEVYGKTASDLGLDDSITTALHVPTPNNIWADEMLTIYDRGIVACQNLYYGGSPHHVEAILPLYTNQTALLARQPSPLQNTAARLASLAQQLASELATDREDFGAAQESAKQAFMYAQVANDRNLQVAALISLANLGFHRKLSNAALQAYQQAISLLDESVTPLLKGRTYAGIAEVYAMRQDLQASMKAMGQAYECYPVLPEEDPAYQYIRASRYALYVFGDAQSRLFLQQPKEADKALNAMEKETNDIETEPITKLDMLYYKADIFIQQREVEPSITVLARAAMLAKQLGSRLYFNKLAVSYNELLKIWPQERQILALDEVFQPW